MTAQDDRVRLALTTLAHDARMALSEEAYEQALTEAERTITYLLADAAQLLPPQMDHPVAQGTWQWIPRTPHGHYRLLDEAGHLFGFISRRSDGTWQCFLHQATAPSGRTQEQHLPSPLPAEHTRE